MPYDPDVGIPPGEMVILFLSGSVGNSPNCPFPSAVPNGTTFGGVDLSAADEARMRELGRP